MESLEKQLQRATRLTQESGGAILVITEGVFGMTGAQGNLKDIVALKSKYNFRLFVDDAHGFGTMEKLVLVQVKSKVAKMELIFILETLLNQWP